MSRFWISILLLEMGLFLVCGGCDDPVDLCDPGVPAGQIHGRVLTGGLPIDAEIIAKRIIEDRGAGSIFVTEPDDGGYYHLDLPFGRYRVKLKIDWRGAAYDYTASGPGYGNVPPDTVVVDGPGSPMKINFDLGGMSLRLDLSETLNGVMGEVILHRREETDPTRWPTYLSGGQAEITDGCLEVGIGGVLPGEYQVQIELGTGETFWVPGTRNQAESPWYEVGVDSIVTVEAGIEAKAARIEGRIAGAWLEMGLSGRPVLSMVNLDSIPVSMPRHTENDGSFGFDIFLPGSVKLQVTQEKISQWIGGPSFDEATVYELQAGQTITDVELIQSGIHFFVETSEEFPGFADFRLYDPVSMNLLVRTNSLSVGSAHVAIPNLWPGNFLVHVSSEEWRVGKTNWRPQWFDRAPEAGQARTITITTAGEIVGLDLVLELGGVISGRVERENGLPMFPHMVITPAEEFSLWGSNYFYDLSGEYDFRGLPDGYYRVGVRPGGLDWEDPLPPGITWYPGTLDWDAADVVEIRDASVVTGVDFLFP